MNIKEIKEMIALMNENNLSELEIEKDGMKIRLKKETGGLITKGEIMMAKPTLVAAPSEIVTEAMVQAVKEEIAGKIFVVKSPMVGTFYVAPAPDQDPYVTKGQMVKEGDVLCIIEAMKLMNEIKSEVSGKILDVLVSNGQAVEYDQPLFKIEKS